MGLCGTGSLDGALSASRSRGAGRPGLRAEPRLAEILPEPVGDAGAGRGPAARYLVENSPGTAHLPAWGASIAVDLRDRPPRPRRRLPAEPTDHRSRDGDGRAARAACQE